MEIFFQSNTDILAISVAISATMLLGFLVFFSNVHSVSNRWFLAFSIMTVVWGTANYFSYHPAIIARPEAMLFLVRFILCSAVLHTLSFFLFVYVFPEERVRFPKWVSWCVIPGAVFVSFFTLTPWVFSGLKQIPGSSLPTPVAQSGIILFAIAIFLLIFGGVFVMVRKIYLAEKAQRTAFVYLFVGMCVMFALVVSFNFVLPVIFENVGFIPFGAIHILPFVILSAYTILYRRLFNPKVIAVTVLAFSLSIIVIGDIIFATTFERLLFKTGEFFLIVLFSIFLMRAVAHEVKQREHIQELADNLQKANDRLVELDRLKNEFLSLASHQMRAPLTSIKGFSSLILEGDLGDVTPKVHDAIERIFASANLMVRSVEDFLNVSRIEQGQMKYDFAQGDIGLLAGEMVKRFKPVADQKKIALTFEPRVSGLTVLMDSYKLEQVLTNLIDNAIKYTLQGTVTVIAERRDNMARIVVKDSGVGMSPEAIGKLFQRFARAEGAGKVNVAGTGLGLYVAKQMIEAHKGKIWAESEGENKGSSFIIELPLILA